MAFMIIYVICIYIDTYICHKKKVVIQNYGVLSSKLIFLNVRLYFIK